MVTATYDHNTSQALLQQLERDTAFFFGEKEKNLKKAQLFKHLESKYADKPKTLHCVCCGLRLRQSTNTDSFHLHANKSTMICLTCWNSIKTGKVPMFSIANGFNLPHYHANQLTYLARSQRTTPKPVSAKQKLTNYRKHDQMLWTPDQVRLFKTQEHLHKRVNFLQTENQLTENCFTLLATTKEKQQLLQAIQNQFKADLHLMIYLRASNIAKSQLTQNNSKSHKHDIITEISKKTNLLLFHDHLVRNYFKASMFHIVNKNQQHSQLKASIPQITTQDKQHIRQALQQPKGHLATQILCKYLPHLHWVGKMPPILPLYRTIPLFPHYIKPMPYHFHTKTCCRQLHILQKSKNTSQLLIVDEISNQKQSRVTSLNFACLQPKPNNAVIFCGDIIQLQPVYAV